ncbi:GEVED domain-containing protein [Salinigranum salinum]|uniref:GEVED domain-containing protein n=1 Tax=Salinigranum salinum TaxID=1364937 RepID=UPI001260FEF3|nr:GEVED domain-containing protein [Salinigranum salinum]
MARSVLGVTVETTDDHRDAVRRVGAVLFAVVLVLSTVPHAAASSHTSSPWEFGDAPDGESTGYPSLFATTGNFPTLLSSDGARTDESLVVLGRTADTEPDARVVNGDTDDGIRGFNLVLSGIPSTTELTVDVTPTAGAPQGATYYLNVLVDMDMDGNWGGTGIGNEPEWAVQNHPVEIQGTEPIEVTPPRFPYGNGNRIPDGAWMRVALTDTPVDGADWDGSGEFGDGEIEDHIVAYPEAKGLQTWCEKYHYDFRSEPSVTFWCAVKNVGSYDRTEYSATLQRERGNVPVDDDMAKAAPGVLNPPGAVGGPMLPPGGGGPAPAVKCPDPNGGAAGGPALFSLDRGQTLTCFYAAGNVGPFPPTSLWNWTVRIADPPSVVHDWGVEIGYSGQGTAPLSFSDVSRVCVGDLVVDVCGEHVGVLTGSVGELEGVDRFVDADDTLAVVWTGGEADAPPNVVVTNVLDPERLDARFYASGVSLPSTDVTVSLSPSTGRAVLNSATPRRTIRQALADGRIVVTFADAGRQVAWNAYRLGVLERQRGSTDGVGTTMSIAGTTGTVERYPGYTNLHRVPVDGGAWVLNDLGTPAGWIPSSTQRFTTPPAGVDVQFDRPPGVLVGPSATTTSTRVAPLLLAGQREGRSLTNAAPALDGTAVGSRMEYVRSAPLQGSTDRAAYTAGTNRLLQAGGGSYAVGLAASTYARQATQATQATQVTQATQATQATQGLQRGTNYGATIASTPSYFSTGVR